MVSEPVRILYIDDNQTDLFLFREVFRHKYEILITTKLDEALASLRKDHFKVVFVDDLMPELSGLEFIEEAIKFPRKVERSSEKQYKNNIS